MSAAFEDISRNPANIAKYKNNPKVQNLMAKMSAKFGAPGGGAGGAGGVDIDMDDGPEFGAPPPRGSDGGSDKPYMPTQPDVD